MNVCNMCFLGITVLESCSSGDDDMDIEEEVITVVEIIIILPLY